MDSKLRLPHRNRSIRRSRLEMALSSSSQGCTRENKTCQRTSVLRQFRHQQPQVCRNSHRVLGGMWNSEREGARERNGETITGDHPNAWPIDRSPSPRGRSSLMSTEHRPCEPHAFHEDGINTLGNSHQDRFLHRRREGSLS